MQIKRRGQRAILIESTYVRKGSEGNTHGFTRPRQVCSVDVNATTIPAEVDALLTKEQRELLMSRVVVPAQRRAAQKRADDEARITDLVQQVFRLVVSPDQISVFGTAH